MMITEKIDRGVARMIVALLVLFSVACVTLFVDPHFRHLKDSAIYLLTARSLAAGHGITYQGMPFFARPPGLSFLLTPFVGGAIDHELLNRGVQLLAALSFGAVAAAFSRLHKPHAALVVALLYAVNAITVHAFNTVMAEFPFMVLFFWGLWLLLPARNGDLAGWGRSLLGVLAMAAAQQFRSVAIIAMAALLIVELPRGGRRRWRALLLASLFGLLCAPGMVQASRLAAAAPRPSTQLLVFDYPTALLRVDSRDPGSAWVSLADLAERTTSNGAAMASSISHSLIGVSDGPLVWFVVSLVGAAAAFSWWRRRSILDWTLLAYLALLLVYFTFAERLLLPLIPLLISSVVYSLECLGEAWASQRRRPESSRWPLVAVALALLTVGLIQLPGALRLDEKQAAWQKVDLAMARWLIDNTSDDARLLTERAAIIELLSGRRTYTFRNLPGPWPEGCPDVDLALIGPRSLRIEKRWKRAASSLATFTVPWLAEQGGMGRVRCYRLPPQSQAVRQSER